MKTINWFEPKITRKSIGPMISTVKSNFISEGEVTKKLENHIDY